jgi:iron complex transport system ATP-binding protein
MLLPGVSVSIDADAVRVSSDRPLQVLSSAAVGGGLVTARNIVNMHVDDRYDGGDPAEDLTAFAARLGVGNPFVGLMTAAYTEYARAAVETYAGGPAAKLTVAAVVSVGLSNTTCAGVSAPAGPRASAPGTINAILVTDALLTPAAMVNAVITATEAKTMALAEWDVRTADGHPASGTSTDAVVVACTGRGAGLSYAGPATPAGWLIARTVRTAVGRICREKLERDGGRRIGW